VALGARNSCAKSGKELLKGSNNTASFLVRTQKNFMVGMCGFFMSDVISGGLLGHHGLLHLALSPNH